MSLVSFLALPLGSFSTAWRKDRVTLLTDGRRPCQRPFEATCYRYPLRTSQCVCQLSGEATVLSCLGRATAITALLCGRLPRDVEVHYDRGVAGFEEDDKGVSIRLRGATNVVRGTASGVYTCVHTRCDNLRMRN
jgi:hypothetical protein